MKLMKLILYGLVAAAFLVPPTESQAQLRWRVSVKFILDSNGNRASSGSINTDAEVQDQIDIGNEVLRATGRGYQLQLTEIVDVSGIDQWFNMDFDDKDAFESDAESNKALYEWRDNAINIYVAGSNESGICSFPGTGDDVILVGQGLRTTTIIHEIGHYLDLCHTQGCPCGSCSATQTGTCHTTPGDDEMSDTPPDLQCWDQDDIAQWTYGQNYNQLTISQQVFVDTSFFNIMSYHGTRNRYSSNQLDRQTDVSNGSRNHVASNETIFVDVDGTDFFANGSSVFPYTLSQGISNAGNFDIVLLRTGDYNENHILNERRYYRATRGNAIIGTSAKKVAIQSDDDNNQRVAKQPIDYPDTFDGRTGP